MYYNKPSESLSDTSALYGCEDDKSSTMTPFLYGNDTADGGEDFGHGGAGIYCFILIGGHIEINWSWYNDSAFNLQFLLKTVRKY